MLGKTNSVLKVFLVATIAVLFMSGFFVFEQKDAEAQNDAIAVRVLANPQHLSPLSWYKSKGFTGNPTPLTVDGYDAIQDGRTVYVNVANVIDDSFYTNIYLISYNQNAAADTVSVFNKILSNWKFNTNLTTQGDCFAGADDNKSCTDDSACPDGFNCESGSCQQHCLVDKDCSEGLCGSLKSQVTRDIKRLANITDLKSQIDAYNQRVGHYPLLSSGTYISGVSVSTWPSWNGEFAAEIGMTPPVDPINKFLNGCGAGYEFSLYDPYTCWDAKTKSFAGTLIYPTISLPYNSRTLVYSTDALGKNFTVCGEMESALRVVDPKGDFSGDYCPGSKSANPVPEISCGGLTGVQNQSFSGFVTVTDKLNNPTAFTIDNLPGGYTFKKTADPHQLEIDAASAVDSGTFDIKVNYQSNTFPGLISQSCQIKISSQAAIIYPIADQKTAINKTLNFSVFAFNSAKNYQGLNFNFDVRPPNVSLQCKQPLVITKDGRARCDVTVSGYSVSVPTQYTVVVSASNNLCPPESNPSTPIPPGTINQPIFNFINNFFISGNYAYVVNWAGNSLLIADISNPAAPRAVGQISDGDGGALLRNPASVTVSGDYAYVASHGDSAFEIINVKNKNNPVHAGSLNLLNGALGVSVVGNYAYLADWEGGDLSVIDVSDKTAPVLKNSVSIVEPYSVITNGGYAYVTRRNGGAYAFQIVDINDPLNPKLIGGVTDAQLNQPLATALYGHYAFVNTWGNSTIVAIDISSKTSPTVVGSFSAPGSPYSVEISGKYAYLPLYHGNALQIVDVSDPANMVQVGIIHNGDGGAHLLNPVSVKVIGNYAFVASQGDNNLEVIDITHPDNPAHYASLTNYQTAKAKSADYTIAAEKDSLSSGDSGLKQDLQIADTATSPECAVYAPQQFNLSVTNNPPVIQALNCDKSVRAGQPYMYKSVDNYGCKIIATDPEGQSVAVTVNGLPAGMFPQPGHIYAPLIYGTPNVDTANAVPYQVSITATDVYGASSPTVTFPLHVNDYCGDGIVQSPNLETKGGHADNGYEDCDCGKYLNADGSINYIKCVQASGCTGVSDPLTAPQCAQNYKQAGFIFGGVPTTTRASFLWQYGCTKKCSPANGGFCGDGTAQDGLLAANGAQEVVNSASNLLLKHGGTDYGEKCDFGGISTNCCDEKTCQWITPDASSTNVASTVSLKSGGSDSLPLPAKVINTRGVLNGSFTAQAFNSDGTDPAKQAVVFLTDASTLGPFESKMGGLISSVQTGMKGFYDISNNNKTNFFVGSVTFGNCSKPTPVNGIIPSPPPNQENNVPPVCNIYDLVNFGGADGEVNFRNESSSVSSYSNYGDYNSNSGADAAITKASNMLDACKIYPHDSPADTAKDLANQSNACYGASQLYMIILTDGVNYDASDQLTKKAKDLGIKIYTIYFQYQDIFNKTMCNWSSDTASTDNSGTPLAGHICNFILNQNNTNPPSPVPPSDNFSFQDNNLSDPAPGTVDIYNHIADVISANLPTHVSVTIGGNPNNQGVDLNDIDIGGGVNNFLLSPGVISCGISGAKPCSTAKNNPAHPAELNIYANFGGGGTVLFKDFTFNVTPPCQIN